MKKPQTITQKIIAKHCNKNYVEEGEFVLARVDLALSNDVTTPLTIKQFYSIFESTNKKPKVFDKNKIAIVMDHFTPNKDIPSAQQNKFTTEFARKFKIKNFYSGGCVGIEHALLPEQGLVFPGDIVIGADSHTCTYGALGAFSTGVGSTDLAAVWATGKVWLKVPQTIKIIYFGKLNKNVFGKDLILATISKIGVDGANYKTIELTGETIKKLSIYSRFSMTNMAIECGAKNGIIEPDEVTFKYLKEVISSKFHKKSLHNFSNLSWLKSDKDVHYEHTIEIDCSKIFPQVALPHLPSNSIDVRKLNKKIYIDQVVIGSCTNGWYEDLYLAAQVLKGKKVNPNVRCLIFPATPKIYKQAVKNGLIEIFLNASCVVNPPTCGPCLGGHLGILAEGEKAVATTNRNFIGRMGHTKSEVYLTNPVVAAYSAIRGYISDC
ncbi:MAG: 3-isopropylmalate dehydratase large subunit [Endomicrobia bacterium]|nr:3-isopropylmalate dehydratase large subunit [Endomicrobiia bacterium]